MSDNRSYAVGMKNQGGAPVYMEDLKLSERSAAPNAASIANLKFLLTTGDDEGFRTAIKAYIDESIRAALGVLVNNLDKGTAISRILATDSSNDLGSITPSNLANVLGVKKWKQASGNNGGVATITTQRVDSILFLRSDVNGNGCGIIYEQIMEGMHYYNLSRNGNTVTLTPTTSLSGHVEYIEW